MINQKKLAVKVMETAKEFTGWKFDMDYRDNTYLVLTTLSNREGQDMAVYFLVEEEEAELVVYSMNCRYDDELVYKKINEMPLGLPVYAVGMGKDRFSINSPMPLEILDREMDIIIRKRMVDMIQAMTDILNFHK